MIYLIVGASCSGKTSFTTNSFLKGSYVEKKDLIWYTECDTSILLGKYNVDKRAKGTDTISRKDIPLIKDQVKNLLTTNKDIVLEGDKVCSSPLCEELIKLGVDVKMYLIKVSPEISYKRNMENNSTSSFSHLKAVCTKADNLFNKYYDKFDGEIVDTSKLTRDNFSVLSKDNYKDICIVDKGLWE